MSPIDTDFTDQTEQEIVHAAHHNALAEAVNALVAEVDELTEPGLQNKFISFYSSPISVDPANGRTVLINDFAFGYFEKTLTLANGAEDGEHLTLMFRTLPQCTWTTNIFDESTAAPGFVFTINGQKTRVFQVVWDEDVTAWRIVEDSESGAPEAWHTVGDTDQPSVGDSWSTASTYPRFRLIDGKCEIDWPNGVYQPSQEGGVPVFTLPYGYAPPHEVSFSWPIYTGAADPALFAVVWVQPDGNVFAAGGSDGFFTLEEATGSFFSFPVAT